MTPERLKEIQLMGFNYFSPETDKNIDWDEVELTALKKLDIAREISGVPYHISSNYRDISNPAGFATDAHRDIPCTAFDITYTDSTQLFRIIFGLIRTGHVRIGINPRNKHVHTDSSKTRPQNVLFIEK